MNTLSDSGVGQAGAASTTSWPSAASSSAPTRRPWIASSSTGASNGLVAVTATRSRPGERRIDFT